MLLDTTKPTDGDLLSTYAAYIREMRTKINEIDTAQTEDLLPSLSTADNADTSPSVTGVFGLKTVNAGATLISFFDDGYEGQVIILVAGEGNTTIQHDTGLIQLTSQANVKLLTGEALLFILSGTVWREVGGYKRTSMKTILTATYQVIATDVALRVNAGSNAIEITLPPASGVSHGHTLRVKKTDSVETNVVSMVRLGTDTINELTGAVVLTLQNESVSFVSDGISDWTTFN